MTLSINFIRINKNILFHGYDLDGNGGVLSTISALQKGDNFRFHVPFRDCSRAVVLKGA